MLTMVRAYGKKTAVHPIGKQWRCMYQTKSFGIMAKQINKQILVSVPKLIIVGGCKGGNSPIMTPYGSPMTSSVGKPCNIHS